jgi:hypothetical protein
LAFFLHFFFAQDNLAYVKWPQESYARDLLSELTQQFATDIPGIKLSVEGVGVHWRCILCCGERIIIVQCFDVKGPDIYLLSRKTIK